MSKKTFETWETPGRSSYNVAIHSNDEESSVNYGSYHRNDLGERGALNHIHYKDGKEIKIEDQGDKLKVTGKIDGKIVYDEFYKKPKR